MKKFKIILLYFFALVFFIPVLISEDSFSPNNYIVTSGPELWDVFVRSADGELRDGMLVVVSE
jgi:hypothetical protein